MVFPRVVASCPPSHSQAPVILLFAHGKGKRGYLNIILLPFICPRIQALQTIEPTANNDTFLTELMYVLVFSIVLVPVGLACLAGGLISLEKSHEMTLLYSVTG